MNEEGQGVLWEISSDIPSDKPSAAAAAAENFKTLCTDVALTKRGVTLPFMYHYYLLPGEDVDSSSESSPPCPAVLEASRCASSSRDGKRV